MESLVTTLAFNYNKGFLGVSVFEANGNRFIITKDIYDSKDCDILKSIIYKLNVELIILSLDIENFRFKCVSETNVRCLIVDRTLFKTRKCTNLAFANKDDYIYTLSSYNALLSWLGDNFIEFTDIKLCKELDFMNKKCLENDYEAENGLVAYIRGYKLVELQLQEYMYFNNEVLKSLCVFRVPIHPNPCMKSKSDDSSLFQAINFTSTSFGSNRLKHWIKFPLKDQKTIEKRRDMIAFVIKSDNIMKLTGLLSKCCNIESNDRKFNQYDKKNYFVNMQRFLQNGLNLLNYLPNKINSKNLIKLIENIENTIEINISNEFFIKGSVNSDLDELKTLYNELPKYLNEVAIKITRDLQISNRIVYFPQLGYLIETNEICNDLDLKFHASNKNYYKNGFMISLDREIGDVFSKIIDCESTILYVLKAEIDDKREEIDALFDFIANMDCLVSLAIAANKHGMKRPTTKKNPSYNIELVELRNIVDPNSIPISIEIKNSVIITGPNGSGKSTLLRMIGSTVILNQIGSFLPCVSATISIFDKLFTKINCIESIKDQKSAFMADAMQLSNAVRFATKESILLVDEFGIGTNIADGVAMLMAIINNTNHITGLFVTHYKDLMPSDFLKNFCFIEIIHAIKNKSHSQDRLSFLLNDLNFNKDFIEKCKQIKEGILVKDKIGSSNDEWAVKVINDFIAEDN